MAVRLTTYVRAALAAGLAAGSAACGGSDERPGAESPVTTGETAGAASGGRTLDMDSVARVQRAESLATASGRWNATEVVSRLEAAGLVVRDLERPARSAGFSPEGLTLSVSGGELVVFVYESAAARAAETDRLDSASASPPGATSAWRAAPRLITSGNLAAVLLTDREQLAERVRNVLTARHRG